MFNKTSVAVIGLILAIAAPIASAGNCDGLYAGKAIKLKNTGAGELFGMKTIDEVVLGVDKQSELVSIKLADSGKTLEGSCYSLKQEIVN